MDRRLQVMYLANLQITDAKLSMPFESSFTGLLDKISLFVEDYCTNKELFRNRMGEIRALQVLEKSRDISSNDLEKIKEEAKSKIETLLDTILSYVLSAPSEKELNSQTKLFKNHKKQSARNLVFSSFMGTMYICLRRFLCF